jgi:hypothetical protein
MELGNQIEQQKNASERRFGSKELLQAEAIGSAIVLQLFALGFHIGPPVVFPPDFQR